jgi:DNA-binding transcriptional LysR family regulator
MNLAELTTFLAVIEAKSLVRAAERLNVTQSTVTARIDSLEQKLGQRLLHRRKSGAELTSAGFKFVRYAEVVTQLWQQARHEIGLPQGFTGICNIGCYVDLWEGLCSRFVDIVREIEPGVAVAVWPGDQHNIDRWLDTGLIDIAFCYSPQAREPHAVRALMTDAFVRVTFEQPRGIAGIAHDYVYVDCGEQFRRDHAVALGTIPPAAMTLASARWAIDHLSRNGGSGYLPLRLLETLPQRRRGRILTTAPVLQQTVYLVENTSVTRHWSWFERVLAEISDTAIGTTSGSNRPARP